MQSIKQFLRHLLSLKFFCQSCIIRLLRECFKYYQYFYKNIYVFLFNCQNLSSFYAQNLQTAHLLSWYIYTLIISRLECLILVILHLLHITRYFSNPTRNFFLRRSKIFINSFFFFNPAFGICDKDNIFFINLFSESRFLMIFCSSFKYLVWQIANQTFQSFPQFTTSIVRAIKNSSFALMTF